MTQLIPEQLPQRQATLRIMASPPSIGIGLRSQEDEVLASDLVGSLSCRICNHCGAKEGAVWPPCHPEGDTC